MLNKIYEFAIDNKLTSSNEFVRKYIKAYIVLDDDGNFLRMEVKDKVDKEKTSCPDFGTVTFGKIANFIIEKVDIIFNFSENNKKSPSYFSLIEEAYGEVEYKEIYPLYNFLIKVKNDNNLYEKIKKELEDSKIKKDEFLSFKIENKKIEEMNFWIPFFKKKYNEYNQKTIIDIESISVITGNKITPLIKETPSLVGGVLGTGIGVLNCPQQSFMSYGFDDKENLHINEEEANIIKAGIEYLLSHNNYNSNFELIHWCKKINKNNENDYDIVFDSLNFFAGKIINEDEFSLGDFQVEDTLLEKLFKCVEKGEDINFEIEDNIYSFCNFRISSKGRYVLNNYKEISAKELIKNLSLWYEDSKVFSNYKTKDMDKSIYKLFFIKNIFHVFYELMENPEATQKQEQLKKEFNDIKLDFLFDIYEGKQIPKKLYIKALLKNKKTMINDNYMDRVPIQIIKIYLIREQRKKGEVTIMPELNKKELNVGYNCGRLFAIYEQIQYSSSGNLNSSITDNYFASAQKTPAFVFGRLASLSTYHLKKLNDGKKIFYEKMLQEISLNIEKFPTTLSIEDQGMFSLGYYQQKAELFKPKENKDSIDNIEINIEEGDI